ncbi:hypothetical protein [Streptomyces sp. IMTB 2501]|uniref:hypothetical protein n=1 Tax=Streptomyces sp. IMTB 2501 TaxID=1776340 RepID=UPI00117FFBE6|nr:hypothetical protein [Streptomyces sp. IMTB 2501]
MRDVDREEFPATERRGGEIALEILQSRAEQAADALEARADAKELDGRRRFGADKAVGYLRAKPPASETTTRSPRAGRSPPA